MYANVVFAIVFACSVQRSRSADYVEDYFDQRIDHFNFLVNGSNTYKQRFLYNDSWWDREGGGPIFFYAGNEGGIVSIWMHCGFLADIAPHFKALVLFAEHRYYGKSLPFGSQSFDGPNVGYLSIEQAMADYAVFLTSYKRSRDAEKSPVIVFGGSYGGMLAAYMRFKYPNIVLGAIAASAPIYQVAGLMPGEKFFEAVTRDFRGSSPKCEAQVRTAFAQMKKWTTLKQSGLWKITRTFNLCQPLQSMHDYDHFLRWVRNAFVNIAMYDYPYPTPSIGLPANPVDVMCERLLGARTPVEGLYQAVSVYYNSTGGAGCFDIWKQFLYCADVTGCGMGPASIAWDYQACTEMNIEGDSTGVDDMFPVLPFNTTMRDEYCQKRWNILPRRNWLDIMYWGKDISSSSNIVFSNGNLDPWSVGGVLSNISDTIVSIMIDGGAHHLDLWGKNPADPPSVVEARAFEIRNIEMWLMNRNISYW